MLSADCVPVMFAIMRPMGGCDNDIMYICHLLYNLLCTNGDQGTEEI